MIALAIVIIILYLLRKLGSMRENISEIFSNSYIKTNNSLNQTYEKI